MVYTKKGYNPKSLLNMRQGLPAGIKHPSWKEKIITREGIFLHLPNHQTITKQGYILEHRFIMEQKLNRDLTEEEVIHHLDFDNMNNDVSNLYLFPNQNEHRKYHQSLRKSIKDELGDGWKFDNRTQKIIIRGDSCGNL